MVFRYIVKVMTRKEATTRPKTINVAKNNHSLRSKILEAKIRQIVRLFAVDMDATQTAAVTGLNRNTTNRYLVAIRERIAICCEAESPVKGEVDESYFGARGKTIAFVLLKRNGRVYANHD